MVAFLKDFFLGGGFMNSKDMRHKKKPLISGKGFQEFLRICHFNEWPIESFKIYNVKK